MSIKAKRATFLCGVKVEKGELQSYASTGRVPFRILAKSGMLMPALDLEAADYYVRPGGNPLTWGVYRRDANVRVASFLPGFPRAVATLKDMLDAALANKRHFKDGTFIALCGSIHEGKRADLIDLAHADAQV